MATEASERSGSRLTKLETAASTGARWFVLLLGWILARNLLESVLEPPRVLGFDWRGEISFGMFFLHFPLFYLVLFLGLALWIHALTRRSISKLSGAISVGFGVLLVAPLVDALLFPGRGADLRYLMGFGDVLWRFWDPTAAVAAVSPGQRLEILLAMAGVAGYVIWIGRTDRWGAGRVWGSAFAAAAGLFLWSAFLGAWPSLFAKLTTGGGYEEAYSSLYRGAGLIDSESRRHALVLVPLALICGALFLWRLAPKRYDAFARHLSWSRLLHYTGMVPVGALLAWSIYRDLMPSLTISAIDGLALLTAWAAMLAAYLAALAWNARFDRAADAINSPERPWVSAPEGPDDPPAFGDLFLERTARGSALVAVFLAVSVGYPALLLVLACLFLGWLYSAPPLRTKRVPLLATFTLALLTVLSLATGFSLVTREMTLQVMPRPLIWILLLGVTLGFAAKDIKDAKGDRATGVTTWATLLGDRSARILIAALIGLSYLAAPLLLPVGAVLWVAAGIAAVMSIALTLRMAKPDTILLLLFLLFGLFLLALLVRDPGALRQEQDFERSRAGVSLLGIEQDLRLMRRADEGLLLPVAEDARRTEQLGRRLGDCRRGLDAHLGERIDEATLQFAAWGGGDSGGEPGAIAERLCDRRPLYSAYRDLAVRTAVRRQDWARAEALASEALALGVRPGDHVRHRAGVRLKRIAADSQPGDRGARGAGGDHSKSGNRVGALQAAAADLRAAFRWGTERPKVCVLWGDYFRLSGDLESAQRAFEEAVSLDPLLPDAYSGLGEVRYERGDLAGAQRTLERAATISPRDPWILNNLGVVRRDRGDLDSAERCFGDAHTIAPRMFEPIFNLGLTAERRGCVSEARRWFREAARIRPGFRPVDEAIRRIGNAEMP